ncbi:MAG: hypothetical protein KBS69_00345, partial [Bacteroidales bacterium]|nr:hypothetical protein [Candidatus Colicola caccequi]
AVEQMQKVQLEKAQVANFNQLSAAPALTVSNQKAAMQPKQMVAKHLDKAQRAQLHQQATNVARTPKRVAQSEELTITESEVDDSYVESDGEWDIYLLTTINGTDVIVNLYGYNETLEGTYDLATNMNEYSCVVDAAFTWSFYEEITACSYTVTSLGEGQYSCEGSFSIESGDFTFSTTLSYAPHVPQVYEITASDFSMVDYGTDMYMTAFDAADNKFLFDVLYTGSFEFGKTYTLADMDSDYSWYKLASGGGNAYTEASITVTKDQDGLLHVVAAVVLDNGDSYDITYDEKAFVPTGVKIEVNGYRLEWSLFE